MSERQDSISIGARTVRIDSDGYKLGYLPRIENTAASQMLDGGDRLTARIVRLRESRNPWERVRVAVELARSGAGWAAY